MQRTRIAFLASVLTVALAVVVPSAFSQGTEARGPGTAVTVLDKLAGIENARDAGIKLDPGATEMMTAAPAGSCVNDPTLPGCPEIKRVATPVTGTGEATAYGPGVTPATVAIASRAAARKVGTARASLAIDQCFVRATAPYYTTGLAHGHAANQCQPTVTWHEVFATLDKRYNGVWSTMVVAQAGPSNPVSTPIVRAYADYFCVKKAQRAFKTIATGYSLLQGVLYTGTNVNDATLASCA
jgi:hypothetical protein